MEIITQENQGSELALKATDLLNVWRDYPANRSRYTQICLAVSIALLDLAPRSRSSISLLDLLPLDSNPASDSTFSFVQLHHRDSRL